MITFAFGMKNYQWVNKILDWRLKHINDKQYMLVLSVLAGFLAGLAAVVIKNSVHLIKYLLTSWFIDYYHNYLYFIYPSIGIAAAVIIAKFLIKKNINHGIPSVLYAISKKRGIIEKHNLFSSVITSALTVGFGGSVGLEGPTVATGAAYGSNIGQIFRLNYKQIILLLGAASAGAMAAIFKAPIAAIVFAVEVIMVDLTMASLVPILLASATAALTSYFVFGMQELYTLEIIEKFVLKDVPFYVLLGILAGLVSAYFTNTYMRISSFFDRYESWKTKLLIGGVSLGVLIYFFPALYGEGYETVFGALNGKTDYLYHNSLFASFESSIWVSFLLIVALILLKVIATSITFGAGGVGGIFAPTLFMGVNLGLLFAQLLNTTSWVSVSERNFALTGMAGLIAGVLQAPLTGIFLIAEITGGYHLFMPLMIVSSISFITVRIFVKNNVYSIQLAERGELLTHHADKNTLKLMNMNELIETDFSFIHPDATLGQLVKVIETSSRNIFPVIDDEKNFYGIIFLDQVREIMFKQNLYDEVLVRNLMFMPSKVVHYKEDMESIAHKFEHSGKYNLVVLKEGKYLGFISRARVFSTYRQMLKDFSEE
jgi:CIC family chloride channel protein